MSRIPAGNLSRRLVDPSRLDRVFMYRDMLGRGMDAYRSVRVLDDKRPPAEAGGLNPFGDTLLPPPEGGGLLMDEMVDLSVVPVSMFEFMWKYRVETDFKGVSIPIPSTSTDYGAHK